VHLGIEGPAGWTLRRAADPQIEPFRRPPSAEAGGLSLTVSLDIEARSGPPGHDLAVTTGWRLERVGERLRWTLPDGQGGWFWRLTSDAEGAASDRVGVELGPVLVDAGTRGLVDPVTYPLDQIIVIHHLHRLGGLLLHAAGVAQDGRGVVVAGVSGAGKTTVSRLLRQVRPELAGLSDDRVIVTPGGAGGKAGWYAWGTPWAGEGRIASPARARLAALVLLRHADAESLRPLSPGAALERLLPAVSVPWYSPPLAELALAALERLLTEVPAWELAFRPIPQAVTPLVELLDGPASDF
jgi:hypothetical protein